MNLPQFPGFSRNVLILRSCHRSMIRQTLFGALALAMACGMNRPARANSEMFPPDAAARKAIDFDGFGFYVNGKRTWIASGSIHYPRVPRELWRDRLLRLKRAGFNCVETYAFWNYHELEEGKFDFAGQKDFGAFLDAAHEVGLYAIVRVGPYVCAEWENGGYPLWLKFKPDVRVRENNPQFLAAMDRWYEHILPIVAAHQIHKGGSVIMVQLENEHPWAWGTDEPTPYFTHMHEKAQAQGIEVPTFFSGLHHGSDPAPRSPESSAKRRTPWFTTEFWPGWYNLYGRLPETGSPSVRKFERGLWRILANGGNGYNFYMIHGGSNFDHWNNDEDAASYDYGAAIGQAGDLRPIYYRFKRATLFARSFESILDESDNATNAFQDAASEVTVAARSSNTGTIVFLDNPVDNPVSARLLDGSEIKLEAGESVGLVHDFFLTKTFKIESAASRILGFARQGAVTTLVIYGQPGESGKLMLNVAGKPVADGSKGWSINPPTPTNAGPVTLAVTFPAAGVEVGPEEHILTSGTEKLRVLAMNKAMTDHTWIIDEQGIQYVVYGPEYAGDFSVTAGKVKLTAEDSLSRQDVCPTLVFGPAEQPQRLTSSGQSAADEPVAPKLENWQTLRADGEAAPELDVAKWKTSDHPLPMGVDNDTSAYAWYRTTIDELEAVKQFLQIPFVGDQAIVFLNGKRISTPASRGTLTVGLELKAGLNTLAILVSHNGRDKFVGTLGPIDKLDVKGIQGPVTFSPLPRSLISLEQWKSRIIAKGVAEPALSTDPGNAGWTEAKIDPGASHLNAISALAVWYRTELPQIPGPNRKVHLAFVYDKAAIYLNGAKLVEVVGGTPVDVKLDAAWKQGSPNILAIRVENVTGAGGFFGQPRIESQMPGAILKGWKMRGGLRDAFDATAKWEDGADAPGVPAFYRAKFTEPAPGGVNAIIRFSPKGLKRGFVWLNGHNLGRYPEKIPVDGFYLPECWLKAGENSLVVLDEEGASPKTAALVVETAASRKINKLGQ